MVDFFQFENWPDKKIDNAKMNIACVSSTQAEMVQSFTVMITIMHYLGSRKVFQVARLKMRKWRREE